MTRLLINLFFIVMLCFTLAAMPINTEALSMFDFGTMFSSEPEEETIITEPVDEAFQPTFTATFDTNAANRLYNPNSITLTLETNIPENYAGNYNFDDLEMTFSRNGDIYQIFKASNFVLNQSMSYINEQLTVIYEIDLSYDGLNLDLDGFYDVSFEFTSPEKSDLNLEAYAIAYRPIIDYVENGAAENNGNFIYKAFFLNESETHLVPLYFSVDYPESITVEARDRLYNAPPTGYGLSSKQVIPSKTSISKIGDKHYGVFMYSNQFPGVIDDATDANLAVNALVKTLIRLPHIEKISLFVDDVQTEGSFFDVDLSQVIEEVPGSYAYLTEPTSSDKRYLVPVPVSEDNIYDEVWSILNVLKTGRNGDDNWTQILPPEVEVANFLIEGTTITLEMNSAFVEVYQDHPEYEKLMLNSLLYSLTSIENISKVAFIVDGEPLTSFAGMDLTEPTLAPPYINYIGEY